MGSNLAEQLLGEGYRVIGLDDLSQGVIEQVPDEVEFYELDIRSTEIYPLCSDVSAVFHLAARNCIADCQADPVETSSVNVQGSVNVFQAAHRARVAKVIYAETSALYEGIHQFPTAEGDIAPQSFYALSKLGVRDFAAGYARHHGLNLTALRYFCVYGPRQDYRRTIPPVMSAFILHLLQGRQPTIYGTGEKRRDFVYIDDVNRFHLQCLLDPRTDGRTFNLGSGRSYSVREVFDAVRTQLGSDIEPNHAPDLPGEAFETRADISAARALGWSPAVELSEGLQRSIAYIRENVLGAESRLAAPAP
ncbi:MAG: NAD-dependent epimerase/dehydratase family protein [Gemmatimonadetes bacterium]|nr:NAD-dependent epimerase/dehydratase family protein [Gemmatimonadota bacterium]